MIYIKPEAGLANRIRALASGLALAKKLNQPLVVVWANEEGFICRYKKLFYPSGEFRVVQTNWVYRMVFYTGTRKPVMVIQKFFQWLLGIDLFISDKDIREFVWDFGGNEIDINLVKRRRKKNIAIKTCHEFLFEEGQLNAFKPIQNIQDRANAVFRNQKGMVGLHIRRTDNENAIALSPLELFIDSIQSELSENPSSRFYLATDDIKVFEELDSIFPGAIIYQQKVLDRNSEQGIEDAFMDILILSKCQKIYGSFYSSFSSVAAAYGNVPLIILKKD